MDRYSFVPAVWVQEPEEHLGRAGPAPVVAPVVVAVVPPAPAPEPYLVDYPNGLPAVVDLEAPAPVPAQATVEEQLAALKRENERKTEEINALQDTVSRLVHTVRLLGHENRARVDQEIADVERRVNNRVNDFGYSVVHQLQELQGSADNTERAIGTVVDCFDAVSRTVADVDERLTQTQNSACDSAISLQQQIDHLHQEVDIVHELVDGVDDSVAELRRDVGFAEEAVGRINTSIDDLRQDVNRVEGGEDLVARYCVSLLAERVHELEQTRNDGQDLPADLKKLEHRLEEVSEQARLAKEEAVRSREETRLAKEDAVRSREETRRLIDDGLLWEREEKRGLKRKLERLEDALESKRKRREVAEARAAGLP
ncbi:hypothetical protein V8F20_006069 [Naviculisporaceae sp. PSN 640]